MHITLGCALVWVYNRGSYIHTHTRMCVLWIRVCVWFFFFCFSWRRHHYLYRQRGRLGMGAPPGLGSSSVGTPVENGRLFERFLINWPLPRWPRAPPPPRPSVSSTATIIIIVQFCDCRGCSPRAVERRRRGGDDGRRCVGQCGRRAQIIATRVGVDEIRGRREFLSTSRESEYILLLSFFFSRLEIFFSRDSASGSFFPLALSSK